MKIFINFFKNWLSQIALRPTTSFCFHFVPSLRYMPTRHPLAGRTREDGLLLVLRFIYDEVLPFSLFPSFPPQTIFPNFAVWKTSPKLQPSNNAPNTSPLSMTL